MKPRKLKLRARFVLFVAAGVLAVGAATGVVSFYEARKALLETRRSELCELARLQATKIALRMAQMADRPLIASAALEVMPQPTEKKIDDLIISVMNYSPQVFGMAVAFEPYAFKPNRRLFGPYYFRGTLGLEKTNLDDPSYNYPIWDWYQVPALLQRPIWSEPYYDEGGGNVLMCTFSAPMLRDQRLWGIMTADISLESLKRKVAGLQVGKSGWAFMISQTGKFIAAPKDDLVMRQSIFSLAEERGSEELRRIGQKMVAGESAVIRTESLENSQMVWLAYAPVEGVGWSVGVVLDEAEVMAPAWGLAKRQAVTLTMGLLGIVLVVWLLVMGLTKPLRDLSAAAARLAAGDLDTTVTGVRPGDEIGDLAESFNTMVADLKRHVAQLTETTAAKERIQSELDMASNIQQSILPRTYPAFPERPEMDIFAKTIPAREVGGDFYDFFMLDKDRVGVVVADVSGKGVPAALFMTVARTLIKNAAAHSPYPDEVLTEVNSQIMPENEMCMFVTVFYGIYNLATGELVYCCAGHPAPFVRRTDGAVEPLEQTDGMAVGIFDELGLTRAETVLQKDEILLAFTDGLDEGINPAEEMFGMERIVRWLDQAEEGGAPDMINDLVDAHRRFTGEAEQFDDLTLLMLRRQS